MAKSGGHGDGKLFMCHAPSGFATASNIHRMPWMHIPLDTSSRLCSMTMFGVVTPNKESSYLRYLRYLTVVAYASNRRCNAKACSQDGRLCLDVPTSSKKLIRGNITAHRPLRFRIFHAPINYQRVAFGSTPPCTISGMQMTSISAL